ncbi:MAG: hypothetical protein ACOCRO_11470 [Halanaerobiales bacterium]
MYIVNTNALYEDYKEEQKGVKAYVKVDFSNDGIDYSLYRSMLGLQEESSKIYEESGEVKLTYIGADGNTETKTDEEEIQSIVNSILDERVKNYFLFDGERIENLTKATKEQKEVVSKGIKNLLKIDELNCSINALKKLYKQIRSELTKISTGKYKELLTKIENAENEKEVLTEDLNQLNKELVSAKKQEKDIDNELAKYDEYKDLINQRKSLKDNLNELDNNKLEEADNIKDFNNDAVILLSEDIIRNAFSEVDKINTNGIDQRSKKLLVEKLLKDMRCICGTNFDENSTHFNKLIEWKDSPDEDVVDDVIKVFRDNLIRTIQFIEDNKQKCEENLYRFSKIEESIEEINSRVERINAEIGDVDDEAFLNKEEYRKDLIEEISRLNIQIENKEKELEEKENEIKRLQNERAEKEKEQNIKNEFTKKLELTEATLNGLINIRDNFIKEVKINLENESTSILKVLIDEETRNTFKKIIVKDDYSLQILDWNNRPFLANISAGQRQVMSLAFITALAKIAGGNTSLEVPLFMDTPFGRLSGKHRDNLINEIPKLTPQWVLLATDTEFTNVEAEELRKSGKWGKVYELELVKDGHAEIKEIKVSNFKPQR